jgi:hypothetical protein
MDDEALRLLTNLAQRYSTWLDAQRVLISGRLAWKTVSGHDYLYRVVDGNGNGRSLGPRSEATERMFTLARTAVETTEVIWPLLKRDAALYRALRLPQISSESAALLREFDLHGLMGPTLMVVGTNAMAAYEIEARSRFATAAGVDTTADFDMTWVAAESRATTLAAVGAAPRTLLDVMKRVDPTYTVNTERSFQARNARGYEVELLMPKLLEDALPRSETLRPVPLMEQDWLLPGRRVEHVVCGLDGLPARIIVPDPRRFALQKLWLSEKPSRDPLKKPKDVKQGALLLDAIEARMPHYPLDDAFRAELSSELLSVFDKWRERR